MRIVAVTGAAAGIGAATARHFAGLGDTVLVLDRDGGGAERIAAELRAVAPAAHAFPVDVGDEAAVDAAAQDIATRFGHIDVLVNNAGIAPREGGLLDITRKAWDLTIRVNLTSVFLVSRAIAPLMPPGSAIVNMSSTVASKTFPGGDAYATAKAGVIALTRSMAVSLADRGIRVNVVCPGVILTEEIERRLDRPDLGPMIEALRPLGRGFGTPAEAAAVIAFLASDAASYINGAVIPVDGGALA